MNDYRTLKLRNLWNGLELAYLPKQKLPMDLWSLHGLRAFTLPFSTSSTNQAVVYNSFSSLPSCVPFFFIPSIFYFLPSLHKTSRPVNVTACGRTDVLFTDGIRWSIHLANVKQHRKPCHVPVPQRSRIHHTTSLERTQL